MNVMIVMFTYKSGLNKIYVDDSTCCGAPLS